MQIGHVLVFLALGAAAEGGRVRRWSSIFSIPMYLRAELLQNKIDSTAEETHFALQDILDEIEKIKENCTTTLSKDLQDTASGFLTKLKEEKEQAKKDGNGNNEEKIEACVDKEQRSYMVLFGENYKTSLICVENATVAAKQWVTVVNNTFHEKAPVDQPYTNYMRQMFNQCVIPKTNHDCFKKLEKEYARRITFTKKVSKEMIQKGKEAVPEYKLKTEVCVQNYKEGLEKLHKNHKNRVKMCVENPKGNNV